MRKYFAFAIALFLGAMLAMPAMAQTIGVQFVDGWGWKSSVVLKNNSTTPQNVGLTFITSTYRFLPVSVNGARLNIFYPDQLAAGEEKILRLAPEDKGELIIGWIELAGEVTATLVREFAGEKYSSPFISPVRRDEFQAVWAPGMITGLAVLNPNAWPTVWQQIKLTAFGENGTRVAQQNLLSPQAIYNGLKPRHQIAKFVGEIFSGNPEWEAYLASHGEFRGKIVIEESSYDPYWSGFAWTAITFKF